MLKGTPNATYSIPVKAVQTYFVNMLYGNTTGETIVIGETSNGGTLVNYYMSGGEFKPVAESLTVPAGKCYLRLPAQAVAPAPGIGSFDDFGKEENDDILVISLDDEAGETTGMGEEVREVKEGRFYDLNGRQLSGKPAQKGVYVKNGKKVVIR